MNFILHPPTAPDRARIGGKAAALAALTEAALPVPPWFVVVPEACQASADDLPSPPHAATDTPDGDYKSPALAPSPELTRQIAAALAQFATPGALFAVRSSAVDEDGGAHSFAGQLESYLNVPAAEVPARVADVWHSGFAPRVWEYRRTRGLTGPPTAPAVLVQVMVAADCAGVAFSADPVSARRGVAVVSAVPGLGDALVSGAVDADTFELGRSGKNLLEQPAAGRSAPVLMPEQARAVAALARRAEAHFGVPQDIEWAIAGGELFLLQSRPITTLASRPDPDGAFNLWDNSNIAESYGGITTPLTYSYARRIYEEAYRQFCRLMGVSETRIADNAETFRSLLGLARGRVFYNLVSWHRVLALLPGYIVNRAFMDQMMGVKEPLPEGALPSPPPATVGAKFRDALALARTVAGLVRNHLALPRQIPRFQARLNRALAEPEPSLEQMRADELAAHYRGIERQLLTRWDAPLVNDFFAMIFHGLLRRLCETWCASPDGALANELIRDEGGIISAEPARRLKELAALATARPELMRALSEGSLGEARRAAAAVPAFQMKLAEYLARFGDRCLDELKLESPTLHDDPLPLFRSIGALARRGPRPATEGADAAASRAQAEEAARTALEGHGLRSLLFHWVLRHARDRVRDRENLRFERTRLFGRVRRTFVELGKRLHADGCLTEPRDVFYLELDEAIGFVTGTTSTTDLKALVALRRAEFDRFRQMPAPADRFVTRGTVHQGNDFQSAAQADAAKLSGAGSDKAEERRGLACCPGIVRGRVRVITEPRGAEIQPGEILVAERTDPGWVMLFPAASGLLVERGSLLSHSAIVSRELGLPGIVSIPGLTTWLRTGDEVEMNGATGVVRRLKPA